MTTNQKAIQRVEDLLIYGKKIVESENGDEIRVRKELEVYHDLRYIVSYTTKNDDINKVMTRLFS